MLTSLLRLVLDTSIIACPANAVLAFQGNRIWKAASAFVPEIGPDFSLGIVGQEENACFSTRDGPFASAGWTKRRIPGAKAQNPARSSCPD